MEREHVPLPMSVLTGLLCIGYLFVLVEVRRRTDAVRRGRRREEEASEM